MTALRELNKKLLGATHNTIRVLRGWHFFLSPHWELTLATTLFFQALHYCLLFCYHLFWNEFSYCSLGDLLQSQYCLYHFLSSISCSRCLCSPKPFCCLFSKSSNKQLLNLDSVLNLQSQEGARLGSKLKLQHSIMSPRCEGSDACWGGFLKLCLPRVFCFINLFARYTLNY